MNSWKEQLSSQIPQDWGKEIDIFETQIELRKRGKLDEKIFAETRLRRGVYGQRYDNGQRHDGEQTQKLAYPSGLLKGPETVWDAPGMLRIKIPFGGVTPDQLDVLAEVAEEYSNGILHVTTRQDFQYHYIHIEDTPDIMRRLAAAGITTREACGNSVRNLTACPKAGVCSGEEFDVTPYARALTDFLLGHPDCQDFGRKVKIAFSGCQGEACGLVMMHDIGALAVKKTRRGKDVHGFALYVGGGLGTVPYQAKLFDAFLPPEELLPISQAIARVFGRLGEKKNRAQARLKFLVVKLGIEEFRRLVWEERQILPDDPHWTSYLDHLPAYGETPLKPPSPLSAEKTLPEGFAEWQRSNVKAQKQTGYAIATVALPLGDLSSDQTRKLADVARRYIGDNIRTTVEQNFVFRWVSEEDLPDLYEDLLEIGLGDSGANTIVDVTACPGTDTCKLGISASRGLAEELRNRLAAKSFEMDEAVRSLRIKVSGCFNSCGQHHVADIGFFGNSRTLNGYKVPHFQVILGGQWAENAGSFGMTIGAIPSRRIPEVVDRITDHFVLVRNQGENFCDFVARIGKKELRSLIENLMKNAPSFEDNPDFYHDWGDPREFTMLDRGIGECAGEVISASQFDLADAEREVFDAQLELEKENYAEADALAYQSMVGASRALVKQQYFDVPEPPDIVVEEFTQRFLDTELFYDKYAKGKFARYLLQRHQQGPVNADADSVHQLIDQAQLFIDAAHACYARCAVE
ncbi:MAG: nitrite/sulfite reductase [SAR324 cluster bacterium]|jgi:sulfite reductase (ferredoxin)|nr:nitrite/sulfite reductase [SAR324 cluster bacterium]MCH2265583.1 nitrite/sulfite reductase [SAR324 cluster bacterium]